MRSAVLALVLLLFGSAAYASTHRLAFYADRELTSCNLVAVTPGLLGVHIVLEGDGLISSLTFRAVKPACMRSAVWVADAWALDGGQGLQAPGNSQDAWGADVVIKNGCQPAPIYLGQILYLLTEPTAPCCVYEPGPYLGPFLGGDPAINIAVVDKCNPPPGIPVDLEFETATSKGLIMNADATCPCQQPLPVRPSTWGSVKALYR